MYDQYVRTTVTSGFRLLKGVLITKLKNREGMEDHIAIHEAPYPHLATMGSELNDAMKEAVMIATWSDYKKPTNHQVRIWYE